MPFPDKLLSAYTCMFAPQKNKQDQKNVERMIDCMGTNGFNSIDVLVLSVRRDDFKLVYETQKDIVKELVDRARSKGMIFNLCLYPYPEGAGTNIEGLDKTETWLRIFPNAVEFAKHSKELGIASIRFDIETTHVRGKIDKAMEEGITKAVKGFADALRAYNPDLILGYMPADHHRLSFAFDRSLATDRLPAILDTWDMYNGEGYTDSIGKRAEAAKKIHPNNRFVPWIRHNMYYSDDIASTAFNAAKNTDGYSSWVWAMLDPEVP